MVTRIVPADPGTAPLLCTLVTYIVPADTGTAPLLCRSVLAIQSTWRMLAYRRAFLRQRRAAVTIQAQVKGRQARAAYAELRRRHAAAVTLQTAYRGHQVRQEFLLQRDAAIAVQMGFRRRQVGWLFTHPLSCKSRWFLRPLASSSSHHCVAVLPCRRCIVLNHSSAISRCSPVW